MLDGEVAAVETVAPETVETVETVETTPSEGEQIDNTDTQDTILGTEDPESTETGGEGELGGEETTEVPDVEFNHSDYGDSTELSDEDFNAGLTEIMGENPSNETKQAVKKLLDKINDSHKGQLETSEKQSRETYDSIMSKPPVEDMAGLNTFINSNPDLKSLAKTMTSATLPKEVIEANIKALNMIRSGSVKGAGNPQNPTSQSTGTQYTPDKIKSKYEDIVMTLDGYKRDAAIKDLKQKASNGADEATTEFIRGFFI